MYNAQKIRVTEAVRSFSELINRVYYKQESFLFVKGGKNVASLEPVAPSAHFNLKNLADLLNHVPKLTKEEVKDFEADIKDSLKNLKKPKNVWA